MPTPTVFADFISTQDGFTFSTDFDITVTTTGVVHQETLRGSGSGNGWDILADVVLNSRDRLNFVFEFQHESFGGSAIPPAILAPMAGDSVAVFANGASELRFNHGLGEDIYEFNYSVTSADRSVMNQITVRGTAVLWGRHVDPPVVSVAEPSTLGLFGAGLLGLGFVSRRRAA